MSHRKSLLAAAAVSAAFAATIPAASANAATTPIVDPTVCSLLDIAKGPLGPTSGLGGSSLADVLSRAGASVGCTPRSQPSFPSFPGFPGFPGFPRQN
ncbi:hypothetical protein OM076_35860 [Solirubrobacter ginsenosidimutans]|uniref:Uncharacterized protein n=1 Tax=Solirubrobacter ginsenosidimutans TaxID=490573 RepID=A0A9X3MZG0_9ACTN|nr:hypothetical protein [Solirubrobacter ginsenosidimutans]MDA0165699.1 hypothetical protein [Solirubrobacter ginsenosidimutans]